MTRDFLLMCAPLQGFTDVAFRHYHAAMFSIGDDCPIYYTPFLRVESGTVRSRDIKELLSPLNANHNLVTQIIFRSPDEFRLLVDTITGYGFTAIDMNLGCPHIPQVKKGRGAGLLEKPEVLREIQSIILNEYPNIKFSLKMRLGISDATGWRDIADIIQKMPLTHITLHPRTAVQQYSGDLDFDQARSFVSEIGHPVIFNGNILCPADIDAVRDTIPDIAGVMVGRGILMRPSLFSEWIGGEVWSDDRVREAILSLHDGIFEYYASVLTGGNTQILTKIKPIWEYFGVNFDRKLVKKILKSGRIESYREAVDMLRRQ
ncbi:MAG: tRNA-dihydrouridine synthase family protein [Muribaculum sp.]|nr:tRNA-dihydrouridine synthase family protein [Muribaculum sp.]